MDNKLGRSFNFIRHGATATMQLKANGTELWVEEYCIQKFSEPRWLKQDWEDQRPVVVALPYGDLEAILGNLPYDGIIGHLFSKCLEVYCPAEYVPLIGYLNRKRAIVFERNPFLTVDEEVVVLKETLDKLLGEYHANETKTRTPKRTRGRGKGNDSGAKAKRHSEGSKRIRDERTDHP